MSREEEQNKASEKGEAKVHAQAGSGTIHSEEHVGSSKHGGIRFKMPSDGEVSDHSCVRTPEHK